MIWITGGLSTYNFAKLTLLLPTKDVSRLYATRGPDLPEGLIYHCMVSVNERFSFLHGGKRAKYPNKRVLNYYGRNGNGYFYFAHNDYKYWRDMKIETLNFESSFLYDWELKKWNKVMISLLPF